MRWRRRSGEAEAAEVRPVRRHPVRRAILGVTALVLAGGAALFLFPAEPETRVEAQSPPLTSTRPSAPVTPAYPTDPDAPWLDAGAALEQIPPAEPPPAPPAPAPEPPTPEAAAPEDVPPAEGAKPTMEPSPVEQMLADTPPFVGAHAPAHAGQRAPGGSAAGLVDGTCFGQPVYGVRPDLLSRLRQVEQQLRGVGSTGESLGVDTIVGYRAGSRAHSTGRAIDLNYFANPYLMHERGEEALDRELGPVYHRIARLVLGRDSAIPDEITRGGVDPDRAMRLYGSLRDESRAMVVYFKLMQDRGALRRHLESLQHPKPPEFWPDLLPGGAVPTADAVQRQMAQDYVTLAGRSGPPAAGLQYPPPATPPGCDPPFTGDPAFRGPEMGFLDLREDLVRALVRAGFQWGGTDLGPASGDLMHFALPR